MIFISYNLKLSNLLFQKFLGNDVNTLRRKTTLLGFTGRVVRFHPTKWNNWPCLRVELMGTKGLCQEEGEQLPIHSLK